MSRILRTGSSILLILILFTVLSSCEKSDNHDPELCGKWEATVVFTDSFSVYTLYEFKSNGKMNAEMRATYHDTGETEIEKGHGKWHTANGYFYATVYDPDEKQYVDWEPCRYIVHGDRLIMIGNITVFFEKVK